jgi:predicted secreted Zn-dependent protease
LRQLASSSQLMAEKLASLRAPLLEPSYDGWRMLGLARSTNATLGLYASSLPTLGSCAEATPLVERIEQLTRSARRHIGILLAAGAAVADGPREAMVALHGLLPEVLAISEQASALGDARGIQLATATVPEGAVEPLGPLTPLPRPTAPPGPPEPGTALAIDAEFFGSGVTVDTYRVSGSTPFEISRSMNERGPYSEWVGGRADAVTAGRVSYRFTATSLSGTCSLVPTASPAIIIRYTITLPRWSPADGTSRATIEWWSDLILEIATHEKRHVAIYRDAQRELNAVLASSTCGNVEARLEDVWTATNRRQCEFDMREYGSALGLSLEACLAG